MRPCPTRSLLTPRFALSESRTLCFLDRRAYAVFERPSGASLIQGSPREALQYVQQDKKLSQNIVAHNQVLHRLASSGERQLALSHLAALEQSGLRLTSATYTSVISEAARRGNVREAEALYKRMEANNVLADAVTASVLILAHSRAGNIDAAMQLLLSSRNVTEASYGSVVQALVKADRSADASTVLAHMRTAGRHAPIAHAILARALLKRNDLSAFKELLAAMRAVQEALPADVYKTLLTETAAKRLSISVDEALALIKREKTIVGRVELTAALEGHLQAGDYLEAEKRLAEMTALGADNAPTVDTFTSAIASLRARRAFEQVLHWATLMEKHIGSQKASAAVCFTVAEAARRLGDVAEEHAWNKKAERKKHKLLAEQQVRASVTAVLGPESTAEVRADVKVGVSSAVPALAVKLKDNVASKSKLLQTLEYETKKGPLLRGLAMLRAHRERHGSAPEVAEWEIVIDNLIHHRYPDLASNVLRVMADQAREPSLALISRVTTANVCREAELGRLRKAEQLLRDSKAPPSEEAVLALARAYAQRGMCSQALAVFRLLGEPDTNAYLTLAKELQAKNALAEARQLWNDFERNGMQHTDESRQLAERVKEAKPKPLM